MSLATPTGRTENRAAARWATPWWTPALPAKVVLLTEATVPFPNMPASWCRTVDYIVQVESVGDPAKISVGAARVTSNPRELMIARYAADVIEHSGYFKPGFSMQTGSGAAATACTRFMEEKMERSGVKARFALGGITGSPGGSAREGAHRKAARYPVL